MIRKTMRELREENQGGPIVKASIGDMTLVKLIRKDKVAKKRLNQFVAMRERVVTRRA